MIGTQKMDWDKLRTFYTVAQSKSLTKAAESLSISQSAISRQISAVESDVGVTLFHRHARGLLLTEQGEILFRTVAEVVNKLQTTQSILAETSERPRGPFHITAPAAIGTIWLTTVMKEFTSLYPDIEVTLFCEDEERDLSMREADVAIRLYPSKHPDLVQKKLVSLSNSLYASNDYLHEYGTPTSIEALKSHRIISFSKSSQLPFPEVNWLLNLPEVKKLKIKPIFQTNSLNSMRRAVKTGIGIAALPDYLMYRARHISRLLPDLKAPETNAYFVYPVELKNSRRIAVFKNFITRKLAEYNFH